MASVTVPTFLSRRSFVSGVEHESLSTFPATNQLNILLHQVILSCSKTIAFIGDCLDDTRYARLVGTKNAVK